jgi:hypothetical protein
MPVTESPLRKTAMLIRSPPPDVPLRAGAAIHTATALDSGETEIWTNDRHLLAAVAHFRPRRAQCLNGSLQLDNSGVPDSPAVCVSTHSVRS